MMITIVQQQQPGGRDEIFITANVGSETLRVATVAKARLYIERVVPPYILKELLVLTIPDTDYIIDPIAFELKLAEQNHGKTKEQ